MGLIFLVVLGFFLFIFIPTIRDYTECSSNGTAQFELLTKLAKENKVSKLEVCKNAQEVIRSFNSCILKAKGKNIIAPLLLNYPPIENPLIKIIKEHNQQCIEYQVEPTF